MDYKYYLIAHQRFVDYVIRFFTCQITDPHMYKRVFDACQDNPYAKEIGNENHSIFLRSGELSSSDFFHYYFIDKSAPVIDRKGIPSYLLHYILDAMCACSILIEQRDVATSNDRCFFLNKHLVSMLYCNDCVENLVYGFSYILSRYRDSLFKIDVFGDIVGSGTGFLARLNYFGSDEKLIVTNRHVAMNKIKIFDRKNEEIIVERVLLPENTDLDVAAIKIRDYEGRLSFGFLGDAEILDEVIVVGYPRIPMTQNAYQVAHRGEVNGFMHDYWGNEHLLYSAVTNPGNSGGPVLNKAGLVVGVATGQIRMQDDPSVQPYFSAIKSQDVLEFLEREVVPNL